MRVVVFGVPLALSGTQCYEWTHVAEELRKKAEMHGPSTKLKVDFCGEFVPFDESQIDLVAQLAVAWHNSAVRDNVTPGAPRNPYEPYRAPEDEPVSLCTDVPSLEQSFESLPGTNDDAEWDEERDGDEVVYNENFEMNEEIVPWRIKQRKDWAEEKYGYYM